MESIRKQTAEARKEKGGEGSVEMAALVSAYETAKTARKLSDGGVVYRSKSGFVLLDEGHGFQSHDNESSEDIYNSGQPDSGAEHAVLVHEMRAEWHEVS